MIRLSGLEGVSIELMIKGKEMRKTRFKLTVAENEIAEKLIKCFIDGVVRGTHPSIAGWIDMEKVGGVAGCDFVETRGGKVRISLNSLLNLRNRVSGKVQFLIDVCSDISRAIEIEKCLRGIVERLRDSLELQGSIVALGWLRMFETSDFPVDPSRVIEANFNFSNWFINASGCSSMLSLEIARGWGSVNWDIVRHTSDKVRNSLPAIKQPDADILKNVKYVLDWEKVLEVLLDESSRVAVEALAFVWFVDYLCESNGLLYDESYAFIQSTSLDILHLYLGKEITEILKGIKELVEELYVISKRDDRVAVDWARIVRLPW